MQLYLVRHAIAGKADPARWPDDSQRPLTEEGIARFRSAARGLATVAPDVERVLSSPWTRAWQTAGRVALEMKKGGVAFLELEDGPAVLRWSVSPKILRRLAGAD